MNKVFILGNLTKDVEVRMTESKKQVASFTIAVNNGKTKEGKDIPADFINIRAWDRLAEILEKYTSKGSKLMVEGAIKTNTYEDKEGNKKSVTYVLARNIELLDSKKKDSKEDAKSKKEEIDAIYEQFGNEVELTADQLPF